MSANRYAAPCERCSVNVAPGDGYLVNLNKWSSSASRSGTRWATYCADKAACAARLDAAADAAANTPAALAAKAAAEAKGKAAEVAASAVLAALQEIDPAVPVYNGKARTYTLADGTDLKMTKRRDGGYNVDGWSGWDTGTLAQTQAWLAVQWLETSPAFDSPAGHVALSVRVQRVREAAMEAAQT